jgi:predicted nucleic acid-binding protein
MRGAGESWSSCDNIGHASNQVLSELFVVLTRHAKRPLSKEKASVIVNGFVDSSKWIRINHTHLTVKRALLDLETINTPFWDLLIAETMREARVRTIYTKNERDFAKIPWIKVADPLFSFFFDYGHRECDAHGKRAPRPRTDL